jgi:hypothetical protein
MRSWLIGHLRCTNIIGEFEAEGEDDLIRRQMLSERIVDLLNHGLKSRKLDKRRV